VLLVRKYDYARMIIFTDRTKETTILSDFFLGMSCRGHGQNQNSGVGARDLGDGSSLWDPGEKPRSEV